jgi:hypothetical protein
LPPAVDSGDLQAAVLWNANVGRNLGIWKFENLARTDLPKGRLPQKFYQEMMYALRAREGEILPLAVSAEKLLFCCSGPNDEVEFMWSPQTLGE